MLRLCGSNDLFVSFSESLRTELKKVVRQQFLSVYEQVHVMKVYMTYAIFLVYLVQKLLFNLKKCKNMLKIENRGYHGNGVVDPKLYAFCSSLDRS